MSAAAIFLVVNFIIGLCFSAVFSVVSIYSRWRSAALLFSAGLFIASLTMLSELAVAYADNPRPWSLAVYGTVLAGLVLLHWGVSVLYGRRFPIWVAIVTFLAGMAAYLLIRDVPRSWWGYGFAYQGPYALVTFSAAINVVLSQRKTAMDRALAIVLALSGLHFFLKAVLAAIMGPGATPSVYISTHYAVLSQSITAVLIVSVGLMLLAVLTLDIMAVERGRAERDSLSGLANRRGFEKATKRAMEQAGERQHAVILCDLDHFKSINDTYGHHAGDMVIRAFGTMIGAQAGAGSIVGRIGGEEFAVFLPDTSPAIAVAVAETLRVGARKMMVPGLPGGFVVTASFGVAALSPRSDLDFALRQADAALYDAKRGGRDCVHQAPGLAA
ncbi:GGDEF domain-containing protein [Neorhizobium sp. JUb45]|uniref:GGDEF domain-containing protein n=1 Tax=unclassified Neorhizobium TaxID=2629175 RepID=UPI00104E2012|nr:GGDEF domain-containing protein [Neorhizobium sp. JUb45]TCR07194.1 diguanylate cyclase (GGDEF)-like protein [Neorhizobium sp. JUb45]